MLFQGLSQACSFSCTGGIQDISSKLPEQSLAIELKANVKTWDVFNKIEIIWTIKHLGQP